MATYYAKAAGGNWSANTTWSATSSAGADNAGPPTASDDVIFDSGSIGTVTVNTTSCVCKSLTCQGSGNSIAFGSGFTLTISGNVTFYSGMTLSGSGTLKINASATLVSNGNTIPGSLTLAYTGTITLGDSGTVTGLVTISNATTLNGNTLTCNGGLQCNAALSGTTNLVIGGSGGSIASSSYAAYVSNNLTINCTSCTFRALFSFRVGVLTYTAGTVGFSATGLSGSILYLYSSATLNTSGMTWNRVALGYGSGSGNNTYTLYSDLNAFAVFSFSGTVIMSGAYNINCQYFGINCYPGTCTFSMVDGTQLNVSTGLLLTSDFTGFYTITIKSITASSPIYLNYSGTREKVKVAGIIFTDVDASGSTCVIDNWHGSTLTRTSNIVNRNHSDFGGAGGISRGRMMIG